MESKERQLCRRAYGCVVGVLTTIIGLYLRLCRGEIQALEQQK